MRTFLDSNALVAVILGEPAMKQVVSLLREGNGAITAANITEVYDVSARREGLSADRVAEVLEPLFQGPLEPIAVDSDLARQAGEIRAKHYHRTKRPLSLADVILLAAARPKDRIATSDRDVLAVAAKLGVETVELPPSR